MAVRVGARRPPRPWPTSAWKGAVKTSGAKGVHVFVPVDDARRSKSRQPRHGRSRRASNGSIPSIATTEFMKENRGSKVFVDATRVGGGDRDRGIQPTRPSGRPGVVSGGWDDLDTVAPADFTIHTALRELGDRDPWASHMPAPQRLHADLVEEGRAIPVARVQAMHEGKRRARERK